MLAVFATRGEQAPELAGFVDVMRQHSVPMPLLTRARRARRLRRHRRRRPADLQHLLRRCAGRIRRGRKVAKHGNRAVTSRCGAADVLEALGVPIELPPDLAVECLRETGFVFLYAPLYHRP